ncbi:methyltransferase domain-containing protein [Patulibacter sp. SYSU D01012]|uniref:class I SAM-dependent methyltransferase n=1 Tax=Patulibacter sp. SYSU D01012 TaxID=2817381 RepID=UPI001B315B99
MPIDFHDPANRETYAGRTADGGWAAAVTAIVDPRGCDVVDVGCGGGTYVRAWRRLGARRVVGVDFSETMLGTARRATAGDAGVELVHGDATATGLPDGCADVVFARALVHHVPDLGAFAREAHRLLRPGGTCIVQDRTMDDVRQPPSARHVRGLLFARAPRLLQVEAARRPSTADVLGALHDAGLHDAATASLWEVRTRHPSRAALLDDLAARRGRSILHELDDAELGDLVDAVRAAVPGGPVVEEDRWTLWTARR